MTKGNGPLVDKGVRGLLRNHLEAATAVARAALRYFEKPSAQAAAVADLARRQAMLDIAVEKAGGPWRAVSLALRGLVDQAGRCAEEANRLKTRCGELERSMAESLCESLSAISLALDARTLEARQEALISAKKWALELERLRRQARAGSFDDPSLVNGLKTGAIAERLSQAGDAAQEAAESLAEAAGEGLWP